MTFVYHDCSDDARTIKKTHIHVRLGGHEIAWKLIEKKNNNKKTHTHNKNGGEAFEK